MVCFKIIPQQQTKNELFPFPSSYCVCCSRLWLLLNCYLRVRMYYECKALFFMYFSARVCEENNPLKCCKVCRLNIFYLWLHGRAMPMLRIHKESVTFLHLNYEQTNMWQSTHRGNYVYSQTVGKHLINVLSLHTSFLYFLNLYVQTLPDHFSPHNEHTIFLFIYLRLLVSLG